MTFKFFRRGSARCIGLLSAFVTILLCLYYISIGQPSQPQQSSKQLFKSKLVGAPSHHSLTNHTWQNWIESNLSILKNKNKPHSKKHFNIDIDNNDGGIVDQNNWKECSALEMSKTDIDTVEEFPKFEFEPDWMKTKEYWDKDLESRYEKSMNTTQEWPLKVIVVPHSHNDPGWLRTFTNYFQTDTRQIINLAVTKMPEYKNMTFIWSEISFLQMWWDQAHPTKQRALKNLIKEGRFEITTGGWVMTDEANVHLYSMVDQLIEGHQWVKTNLQFIPKTGWSIDPFGHGSTVPYLLASSGFTGTIIQRIHYAWKQWFAKKQAGDFHWLNSWQSPKKKENQKQSMLTHNMPYDIYSIKHSCGPHPYSCLNFDFRKIPGEYTEYSIKASFITDENLQAKADLLMEQYTRTASMSLSNVILVPVGDDFRYNKEKEVDQQYTNYKKLIDYINANKNRYHNATLQFGTPIDYFNVVNERYQKFPTLKGDFFVYSDIFSEGRPAYWSGYYTTRPFFKILGRDLEHNLRALEILFTLAFNKARQNDQSNAYKIYEKNYEKMIQARRNLGLFQHHDAITGTSKANVMRDYALRMFESIQDTVKLQQQTIELLVQDKDHFEHDFLISELERDNFSKLPRKTIISVSPEKSTDVILYNSLGQERFEVVLLRTNSPNVKVLDFNGIDMDYQINPVWNITESTDYTLVRRIVVSEKEFEIMFIAKLPALSLVTFTVTYSNDTKNKMATLYCDDCREEVNLKEDKSKENIKHHQQFDVRNKQPGDIQLENYKMRLLFDEQSGFLKSLTKKNWGKPIQLAIKFGAYKSAQFHSGAYLFRPESNDARSAEKDVLEPYNERKILITSGPIASDVTSIYGAFMAHTARIFNTKTYLDNSIYVENDIDFEMPPKNRETEMYMRFITDIENGENPEFYTDLNGFQWQHRVKTQAIGVEGNYFPITTSAFIQDEKLRLTLMTTHAQGAASLEPGQMEVMLDRRTLYDDYRGMGEGIVDSKLTRHRFWLSVESFKEYKKSSDSESTKKLYQVPSLQTHHMINSLNYPANIYFIEKYDDTIKLNLNKNVQLLNYNLPCDLHLMTLRTLTEETLPLFPSRSALLIVHRLGYNCELENGASEDSLEDDENLLKKCSKAKTSFSKLRLLKDLELEEVMSTTLTGLKSNGRVASFASEAIEPMELKTFNITFA